MAVRPQLSAFAKNRLGYVNPATQPGWGTPAYPRKPAPAKAAPVASGPIAGGGLPQTGPAGGAGPAGQGNPADAWKSDPRYLAAVNAAGTSEANVLADTQYDLGATGQDYGFSSTLNADGTYTFGTDPSNPFSKAALLQRSFDIAKRGTQNNAAAAGQLYAGSLQNAQGANQSGYDQGYDSLQRSWDAYVQSIIRRRRDAKQNTVDTAAGAGADVISSLAGI